MTVSLDVEKERIGPGLSGAYFQAFGSLNKPQGFADTLSSNTVSPCAGRRKFALEVRESCPIQDHNVPTYRCSSLSGSAHLCGRLRPNGLG